MNSILARIFLAVQERIQAEVPEVKWIDQDLGQLEYYGERPPVMFPAVLLDLPDSQFSDMGENSQIGEPVLEVRLALDVYVPSAHIHPVSQREKALAYFDVEHKLNKALHGWCDSSLFSPLSRVSAQTERREDNIRVRLLRYKLAYQDNTAMALPDVTITRPDLEFI